MTKFTRPDLARRKGRAGASAPRLYAVDGDPQTHPKFAEILVAQGVISRDDMMTALALQRHQDLPLGEILMAHGLLSETQLLAALSTQFKTRILADDEMDIDPEAAPHFNAKTALSLGALPLRRAGPALIVATNRPDKAHQIQDVLGHDGPILFALAKRKQMQSLITERFGTALIRRAEARTPGHISCREWRADRARRFWGAAILAFLGLLAVWPSVAVALIFGLAILISIGNTAVKWLALQADYISARKQRKMPTPEPQANVPEPIRRMPVVTILLPLFKERDIAGHLIKRIGHLDYPRELLDVLLLIEEDDGTTRAALSDTDLPTWMRAIIVPPGNPRTKPRALNYGLNFARGSIVGIYDAEDAPEPDQIRKVAKRFLELPEEIVCLQGQLDYYNPSHNWLSRCFTIEYATWFRLLLPGVQKLGLFVPLGGTTLFFRRKPLEDMGAWDAHNVTEDADLGLRLVRMGFQTEIIETTTFEEANSAIWPWIKQRSRWLKGYAMTWATHMRSPPKLWRDLGPKRFIGFQIQVLGAVLGFALAPLLWTLSVKLFGYSHPLDRFIPPMGYIGLGIYFLASQALTFLAAWRASSLPRHRRLRIWIPLLDFYFLFASAASLMGLIELMIKPFHWRKTEHGKFSTETQADKLLPDDTDQSMARDWALRRTSNAVDK